MFRSARLQLTTWYLLIIMVVSGVFSVAFYNLSSREIQRILNRNTLDITQRQPMVVKLIPPRGPSLAELEQAQARLRMMLWLINIGIFILAGMGGYVLAGRTLRPIQTMVDEQNQFISNASHELRTPIATLRAEMEASLLEKHISDKEARQLITSNLEELTTLQNLANKLLRLTQLHAPFQKQCLTKISLFGVLNQSKKNVLALAERKNIEIFMEATELFVKGEETALVQLFTILFDNAIKYSQKNTEIMVTMKKNYHQVTIAVADQGCGIAPTDLVHIFERFYRADKSHGSEGFGIGLSIAKKIVEQHNGKIEVSSKVGDGSVFTVTLPLFLESEKANNKL